MRGGLLAARPACSHPGIGLRNRAPPRARAPAPQLRPHVEARCLAEPTLSEPPPADEPPHPQAVAVARLYGSGGGELLAADFACTSPSGAPPMGKEEFIASLRGGRLLGWVVDPTSRAVVAADGGSVHFLKFDEDGRIAAVSVSDSGSGGVGGGSGGVGSAGDAQLQTAADSAGGAAARRIRRSPAAGARRGQQPEQE